eukprot:1583403-Prymnesium_polylepis.2
MPCSLCRSGRLLDRASRLSCHLGKPPTWPFQAQNLDSGHSVPHQTPCAVMQASRSRPRLV